MSFNLRQEKFDPITILRNASPMLSDLLDSDLDSLSNEEIIKLAHTIKMAVHGTGSNWVRDEPNSSPYKTSPLVNYQGPQFGGEFRNDFLGANDPEIKEIKDVDDVYDGKETSPRLDKLLKDTKRPHVVRFNLGDGERGTEEIAKELFGEEAKTDGRSIYVLVNGYEEALKIQGTVPGSIIETKGDVK